MMFDRQAVRDRAADAIAPRELVVIGKTANGWTNALGPDPYIRVCRDKKCWCRACKERRTDRSRRYRAKKRAG
jgi:hypothetical protein